MTGKLSPRENPAQYKHLSYIKMKKNLLFDNKNGLLLIYISEISRALSQLI